VNSEVGWKAGAGIFCPLSMMRECCESSTIGAGTWQESRSLGIEWGDAASRGLTRGMSTSVYSAHCPS
jgi:hypothetical protein